MGTQAKILFGIIGLLFLCLVVWVVYTTPEPPPNEPPMDMEQKMVYEGNELSEERNGKKLWDLKAVRMEVGLKDGNTEMMDLTGHFYPEDGTAVTLKAKHGLYLQEKKEIHLDGEVVATTSEGARLTSGKLDWLEKEGIMVATENVKITKDDVEATGDRIESRNGFSHFRIRGNARVLKGAKKGA